MHLFMPPKGRFRSRTIQQLVHTRPAWSRRATRCTLPTSRDHTRTPLPRATASSSVSKGLTQTTGPKISSCMTREPSATPVSTGRFRSRTIQQLVHTRPAWSRRATRCTLPTSRDHTRTPLPRATASSSVSKGLTQTTGPKISSCMTREPSATPVSTVAGMKCSLLMRAPLLLLGSEGGPVVHFLAAATNLSRNSGYMLLST
ncbi:hypothetical protein CRUP_022948 [Coryphaenoides rupestris]|nr:hypothetical protein CRUP_022948 [Coryphaenoides rupestris]